MKKRFISIILAISFLFSLVPAVRAEEKAAQPGSIEEQIRAYADSIDQNGAESTAAMTLATHGITGGGKKLTMDSGSALTAVLLNSEDVQVGLAAIFADTMETMQRLDMAVPPPIEVHFNWYGTYANYRSYIITENSADPVNWDWAQNDVDYYGKRNDYDTALEWMVSHCNGTLTLECIRDDGSERTYHVTMTIRDRFDFHTASSSGFKKFLSGIGMALFKEFEWECSVSFEITAPYSYAHCTHQYGAYRWRYDGENLAMIADASEGWLPNNTEHRVFTNANGTEAHYYALDNPIRLDHDRPWVLEYDTAKPRQLVFSPVESIFAKTQLSIWQTSSINIFATSREYFLTSVEDGLEVYDTANHDYGTELRTLFDYRYEKLHTFRLENIIAADGSNMIYLTVTDPETGVVYLDRIPMDDHYYVTAKTTERLSEESDFLSGKDFHINFFGNTRYTFSAGYLDLRIWENGKDGGSGDYFITETTEPSCTTPGGTTRTCSKCGYSEQLDYLPATGHDFTDWQTVKEATCTEEGRMERSCKTCGHKESRPVAVIPHVYAPAVTAPSCEAGGFTTYTCACGDYYVADYTDALGHDLTDWAVTNAPTCTEDGVEERWCQRCEHRESRTVDPLGHSYEATVVDAQCTVGGYTEYVCFCGDSYRTNFTNPTGHHYEGVVTEPGCTEMGYTTYTCVCGDSYKSNFTAPVGHRYESVVTAPTCTEGGFTTYVCVCGDSYISNYTNALGHEYVDGSCSRCNEIDPNYQKPVENPFTDVPEDSFYFSPVLWAVENGITTGASADSFNPGGECMRAHVVTFLWRAAGSPEPLSSNNPFVDVKESDFYYKAVLWAVENGITNGADATHFNPFGICNRAQVVTFLYRAFGSPPVESENNPFTDVPTGGWYTAPVLWAVRNGITNGLSADSFGPNSPCNRAQVVTFLHRAYN